MGGYSQSKPTQISPQSTGESNYKPLTPFIMPDSIGKPELVTEGIVSAAKDIGGALNQITK